MKKATVMRLVYTGAIGLSVMLGAAPLAAQAENTQPHVCSVFADAADSEGVQTVRAGCWGTGLVLGQAEDFQTLTNEDLPATLAVLSNHGAIRILLLREGVGGQPIVEDLGSVLAVAGGRGPFGSAADLPVDFTQFESAGIIGVGQTGETAGDTPEGASAGAAKTNSVQKRVGTASAIAPGAVDIGALIANDPAVASAQDGQ